MCLKKKKELWINTVKQYNLKGKHYFIDVVTEAPLLNSLMIKSYPTYSIINKNGEILYSDNQFKPSSGNKIDKIFYSLINE